MESSSPPASSLLQHDEDLTKLSISELISNLRTAFQTDEYDRVEQALISKELKMKREIEEKTKKIGSINSKAELALLDKMRIEEEMHKQKEQLDKHWKEEKAAKERYETLMKKLKENASEATGVVDELRTKICKLENEKQTLIEHWEMKVGDLTKRVSRLEDETKLLMNGDCSNVGVNTEWASRADTKTRVVKEEKETLSSLHRNASAHFSSGAVIRQFSSKDVLPAPVIVVDSDEDECNGIQGKDGTAQIVAENGKGGDSTGAVQQEHGIGMLKRKLASTSPLHNFGSPGSSSSSSDSDSDGEFDMDRIPLLNGHNHFKWRKIK